ncbi:MAG: nucleotidyltransferase domain-containing protein [Chloroflexota bacterium]|nr:nucleotidyltransferase domain-containing protein [Chloroflexota bacterium]MDE2961270.1 nucleotidyltransferase domain-containing protein [Chloroflexota bacterium]
MTATPNYDERAIAVAQVIRDVIQPVDIFLFGSRARGDWRDDSDIDIFTISESDADTKEKYQLGLQAGKAKALEIYGHPVKIDLVRYSPADFHRYRRARTHLTYAALRDGIKMNHEPANEGDRYPHTQPNNWPDVEQRFINYQRQVLLAEIALDAGLGYEEVGHNFQRCLENALKGFLAYMQYDDGQGNTWLRTHDIGVLQRAVNAFADGRRILAGNDFSFLTEYAIDAPYEGVQEPPPDEAGVLSAIKATVGAMMEFIENDAGARLPRYAPPGPRG